VSGLGVWKAAIAFGVLLTSSCYQQTTVDREILSQAGPRDAAPAGMTFAVALADPIDSNVAERTFKATLMGPIMAADGSTIVRNGSIVVGHATAVRGPSGDGLQLELDSIETIHGRARLFATIVSGQRNSALATLDVQGPGNGYDALLVPPPATSVPAFRRPPAAIGGGPREAPTDEFGQPLPEPTPAPPMGRATSIYLRRGTRLELMLTRPLTATRTD
jgi:hypothetical protein